MIDRPLLQLTNFKPLIDTCRLFIESKMFLLANTIIDGLIYNSFNIKSFHDEIIKISESKKNTYIIFVESNGNGHITQMKHIIELLKSKYKCVGIITGRQKKNSTMFKFFLMQLNMPLISTALSEMLLDQ